MGFTEYCIKYKAKISIDHKPEFNKIEYRFWYPNNKSQLLEIPVCEFSHSNVTADFIESMIIEQVEKEYNENIKEE